MKWAEECGCCDPGCNVHDGFNSCRNEAKVTVYRTDMLDVSGTKMCRKCAMDALESGVFTTEVN